MWKYVADHFKSIDYLAGYEVMAEPRDQSLSAKQVATMYRGACEAVQSVDPNTPCVVGPRSYYKVFAIDDNMYM